MSSTGRISDRQADDFYETPAWATRAILPHLGSLGGRRILEPSAGRGAIVRELLRCGADSHTMTAVEMSGERASYCAGSFPGISMIPDDFTACKGAAFGRFDLVVMNPPFLAAQAHVEHAISLLAAGGTCAALLRLAFLASAKRAAFRKAYPFDLYPLASRPSFTPDGKTDSADYAWFVFGYRPEASPVERCGGRFAVLEGRG